MNDDLYKKLCNNTKGYNTFSHYTDIDSLEKIISSKSLRLSRLNHVNDLYEDKRIIDLWKNKIYVVCLTHRQNESVMFWKLYAKYEKGVMITFKNKFDTNCIQIFGDAKCEQDKLNQIKETNSKHVAYDSISDWGYFAIMFADIKYTNNFEQFIEVDSDLKDFYKDTIMINGQSKDFIHHKYQGLIKGIEWDNEEESRILVAVRPKGWESTFGRAPNLYFQPEFNYLYLKLIPSFIEGVTITLNPWATNELKQRVEKIMLNSGICEYRIKDSKITGLVKSSPR